MNDEWVWVPVEEILQTINGSMDAGCILNYRSSVYQRYTDSGEHEFSDADRSYFLARMIEYKAADDNFGSLVDAIIENGWTSAISWDPGRQYLGNGHHRLVAAILLCEDSVPTTPQGTIWSDNLGEIGWGQEDYDDPGQLHASMDDGRWNGIDVKYDITDPG